MPMNFEPGPLNLIEVTWIGDPNTPAGTVVVRGPGGVSESGKPFTPPYEPIEDFVVTLDKDGKEVTAAEVGILDTVNQGEKMVDGTRVPHYTASIAVGCVIARDKVIGLTPDNEATIERITRNNRASKRIKFVGQYPGIENPVTWLKAPEKPKPIQASAPRRPATPTKPQVANQPANPVPAAPSAPATPAPSGGSGATS